MTTTNAAGHAGEVLTRASIDHAIAQTRMVFDSEGSAGQALDYLEQALNCEQGIAAGLFGAGIARTSTFEAGDIAADEPAARSAVPASARAQLVVVNSSTGLPMQILNVPHATALDTLSFIRDMIDTIGLERMARHDGKTFDHPLAGGIGAQLIDSVTARPKG